MKLIKPSFEIIEQPSGLEGIYKQIELVGRVSYKSEDKITEGSAKEFVDRMIKLGHGAVLEHGTVYLKFIGEGLDYDLGSRFDDFPQYHYSVQKYINNKYSVVKEDEETGDMYVTTNYRVLVENNWLDDLKYLCEPTEFHKKRVCVKFICDRGVSHEFVRHRHFSFMQESTRYCNYSKNKFSNELTFIEPCWSVNMNIFEKDPGITAEYTYDYTEQEKNISASAILFEQLERAEKSYLELIERSWNPQQARAVLPNALKTELYMTGFISDWKHFFELRSNKYGRGGAHPQADELATPLYEEFKKRNLI